jgi:hypothetical protein
VPVLAIGVLLAQWFGAAAADAAVDHDGRWTGTSAADGSYAQVYGNGFSANSGQCVIYAALSFDDTASRQIESGLVRCNGANIDGTCADGHAFVETVANGNYSCTQGYSITNNTGYDATTYRTGSTSTTFHGHVNGANGDVGGFGLTDWIKGETWGEATGGSACPAPSKGTFLSWERYDTSTGWHYVTSSSIHRIVQGTMSGTPCWATVSTVSSTGDYVVD